MCEICDYKREPSLLGTDEWDKGWSIVEEKHGKCVVSIPRWAFAKDTETSLDERLGLIGIVLLSKIHCEGVHKEKLVLAFQFHKKYVKKIRAIEKKYFSGKINVDAKQMSIGMMSVVNGLLNNVVRIHREKRRK